VSLSLVRFAGGSGSLGQWGAMWLTGASSAVIKTTHCEDIDVPAAVAEDRPGGIVLLNDAMGRILFLPYRGEVMAGFDLADGEKLFPPVTSGASTRTSDAGRSTACFTGRSCWFPLMGGGAGSTRAGVWTMACGCALAGEGRHRWQDNGVHDRRRFR
jgi:hypothetical protein